MRTFVIGDPQGPVAKVMAVLDRHGLLVGDRLAPDVVLVSIGDHFDYDHRDPIAAGQEGLALLGWLAGHDPAQVHLVLGNHDAARVMELAKLSDADFTLARTCSSDDYAARFAALPPQHVLARDYASFSVAQRELVRELLVADLFHLAIEATLLDGRSALVTHAGITTRELGLLGLPGVRSTRAIAAALDAHLRAAVAHSTSPLSLVPLHVAGADGKEGGGLLYHRPSATPAPDPERPRRFDPRTLPEGVVQIVGHTGHSKCVEELGDWCTHRARQRAHGGIRMLRASGDVVTYDVGVATADLGGAELILIDGELRRLPPEQVDLLEVRGVSVLA
jgi:hypothetical protein